LVPKSISVQWKAARENVTEEEEQPADNHKDNPDPFLLTGTMIMSGQGKAVVCAVGKNTRQSRNRQVGDLVIKDTQTYYEDRLEDMVKQISKYAVMIAVAIIITQFFYLSILLMV